MKTRHISSLVLIAALGLCNVAVAGDDKPTNALKMSQILTNMQKDGYMVVKDIEYKDKKYKATALKGDGSKVDLEISAETGEILKPKDEARVISILQAAQTAENAGYNVYKIEASDKKYELKAYKGDKKTSLKINAQTGAMDE